MSNQSHLGRSPLSYFLTNWNKASLKADQMTCPMVKLPSPASPSHPLSPSYSASSYPLNHPLRHPSTEIDGACHAAASSRRSFLVTTYIKLVVHFRSPFLSKQTKGRAAHRCGRTRSLDIPDGKCDLRVQWQVTVANRQCNPLVPPTQR